MYLQGHKTRLVQARVRAVSIFADYPAGFLSMMSWFCPYRSIILKTESRLQIKRRIFFPKKWQCPVGGEDKNGFFFKNDEADVSSISPSSSRYD